jgi:hypothetical protein
LLSGTINEGLFDGYVKDILLSFDAFYFNFTNPYTVVYSTHLTRIDYESETSESLDIYII